MIDVIVCFILVAVPTAIIGAIWWWLYVSGVAVPVPVGAGVLWVAWLPVSAFAALLRRSRGEW